MTRLFVMAVGVFLAAATQARAEFDHAWSYDWFALTPVVYSDGFDGVDPTSAVGKITLSNQDFKTSFAEGTQDVATNLESFFTGAPGQANFTASANTFSLRIGVRDTADAAGPAYLEFTGHFSGVEGESADPNVGFFKPGSALLGAQFDDAVKSIEHGDFKFTVRLTTVIGPSFPGDINGNDGAIRATISVEEIDDNGGGMNETPEPATLALSALGLAGLGLAGLRKRWTLRG